MTNLTQLYKVTATNGTKTIESVVLGRTEDSRLRRVCRDNKIPKTKWESFTTVSEKRHDR